MITVKKVETQFKKNLQVAIKELSNTVVKVGWLQEKRYKGKPFNVGPVKPPTVAEVAFLNEKGIYARPFIRPTIKKQENNWRKIAFNKSKMIIKGESNAHELMETIGEKARFDIQKTIKEIWNPPLKPSTIMARINRYSNDPDLSESTRKQRKSKLKKFVPSGLYKPLIDTSLMFSTITFSVENEE